MGQLVGPFAEKFPALERKYGTPGAVDPQWHQGHSRFFRDEFHAAFQLVERAVAGQLAFGKEADDVAVFQRIDGDAERFAGLVLADGDRIENTAEPGDGRPFHESLIHYEANVAGAGGGDEECVGKGDMVRQQKHAAGFREIADVQNADPVNQPHDREAEGSDHKTLPVHRGGG